MARLMAEYRGEIRGRLAEQLGRSNPHALPELKKIVVSMGVGQASQERKRLEEAAAQLAQLTR